jgi:PD-(D/E)XK nuclease superfamily
MVEHITTIRASALSNYPDCNRRGAARLFWREIAAAGFQLRTPPRGIGAAIGTAVHKAAEITLSEKARGSLPPASVAADAAADTLRENLHDDTLFDRYTTNETAAGVQAVSMARAYHQHIAPSVEPLLIEERLEAEVAPGLILSGQADLVAKEPNRLRDLKTSTRAGGGNHAPQIGAYSLLARSHGLAVEEAAIDTIQRVAIGKVQPNPASVAVRLAEAETAASNILRHIAADLDTFRHGDPVRHILPGDPWAFLANPSSILCSPKYCPAFGTGFCREGDPAKERTENG